MIPQLLKSLTTCSRCRARLEFWSDGMGNVTPHETGCTCEPAPAAEPEPRRGPAMTGACRDCGDPCQSNALRCVPCGHLWGNAKESKRQRDLHRQRTIQRAKRAGQLGVCSTCGQIGRTVEGGCERCAGVAA